jgi:hypothetical protein
LIGPLASVPVEAVMPEVARQVLVAQPQGLEGAGAVVLDQHVGPVGDQPLERLAPALGLEVQRDGALVRALGEEAGAHHRLVQRVVGPRLPALVGLVGVVHLDDVGAEDGQLVGGERPGQHVGAVEDPDAFEWPHAVPLPELGAPRVPSPAEEPCR